MDTMQEKHCCFRFLLAFALLLCLPCIAGSSQTVSQMAHGSPASPTLWPSSVLVRSSSGDKCSGTLVGPNVLLTAAHCVGADHQVVVDSSKFVCTPSTTGSCPQQGPDLALCRTEQALGIRKPFERLTRDSNWSLQKHPVTLVGFGEPKLGVLQIGAAFPAPPTMQKTGCITVHWGATVCDGDSGGGTFMGTGPGRALVGVISVKILEPARASMVHPRLVANKNLAPGNGKGNKGSTSTACQANASGLTDITSGPAVAFIKKWRQDNSDVKICGLDPIPECR